MNDVGFTRSRSHRNWGQRKTLFQANVKLTDDAMIRDKVLLHSEWYDEFAPNTALGCLPRLLLRPSQLLRDSVETYLHKIEAHAQEHGYTKLMGIHYRVGDSCVRRND